MWLSKIGFVSKFIPFSKSLLGREIKWGKIKDQFSLAKTMLELVVYIYTHYLKANEDKVLIEKLN